ncbi:MAG: potassium channel protein [Myxococcota bacterium]
MATLERTERSVYRRLQTAALALTGVLALGSTLYYQLGEGRWSFFDCFYMTVITLSTVGFGETLEGMNDVPEARLVTLLLIVAGSGTLLYLVSTVTAMIVEGDLQGMLRAQRMQQRIDKLEAHIVVCGVGNTGEHVVKELLEVGEPFVIIEANAQRVQLLAQDLGQELLHVVGDATDDHSLTAAGIARAKGVIAALHDDKDNLFVTISARHLNPSARIVAKAVEASTEPKLARAGADAIVSPNFMGGLRLVSEMIRPAAVQFLDRMLRTDRSLRIEDVVIPEGSNLVGHTLADAAIRETGALVLAVQQPNGGEYIYNPQGDLRLEAGGTLIVIAPQEDLARLQHGLVADALLRPTSA